MFDVKEPRIICKFSSKIQAATHRDSNEFLHQVSVLCEQAHFFRAKLKSDISSKLTLLLQQNSTDNTDATLEKLYKFALLAEKMVPKQLHLQLQQLFNLLLEMVPLVFTVGSQDMLLKTVPKRRETEKPCQKYMDSGKARFAPENEWDVRQKKPNGTNNSHSVLLQDEHTSPNLLPL